MLSLGTLRPSDDAFIDIYHEILKHELCLMRLGDLCFNLNGYYVSRSRQSVVHNVDIKLTILDLAYAVLKSSILKSGYKFNVRDFNEFIGKLVESRLLVDLPCSDEERELILNALNQAPLINPRLGDNPFIYYYMANELRKRLREGFGEVEEYLRANAGRCFKTAYGELIRLFRYEVALPRGPRGVSSMPYRVLESYILPFIEELLPLRRPEKLNEVCGKLIDSYGDDGKVICRGLQEIGVSGLDDYQSEMIKRMIEKLNTPKIVVISAPTGSGKTLIFMTYVILKLLKHGGAAVIIYPTKVLAREQLEFMLKLLYSINVSLGKKVHVYIIDGDSPRSIKALKAKPFRGGISIGGGTLHYDEEGSIRLVKDETPGELIDWVSEVRPSKIEEPAVVITNHSMLSLHLNKGSSWVRDLLSKLNTVVVDEAHIYVNNFDLLNVLHFLITRLFVAMLINDALNKGRNIYDLTILEGIRKLVNERKIDLILSSATLGDRRVIEEGIVISQLGGVNLASVRNNQEPNLRPLLKWLVNVYDRESKIYVPYYSVITGSNAKRRLIITVVNFPIPSESAQNPFIEGLASTIIWTEALSIGLRKAYNMNNELHALAFIDSKSTQREVFNRLITRGIQRTAFHADKLLVSPLMDITTNGRDIIEELLRSTDDPLTDPYLSTYSHLQLFYKHDDLRNYVISYNVLYNGDREGIKQLRSLVRDAVEFAESIYSAHLDGARFWNYSNNVNYVMLHNADLEMHERSYIENIFKSGKWRLVIATSTLELGVNIPSVALVIQHGSPPSSESFIQRVGRAGRDNSSLRISFGALFMKSVGKDISYIDEVQAFKSLFNLEQPRYSEEPDEETLIRFMGLLYKDLSKSIEIGKVETILERSLMELYNIENNKAKNLVNEISKLINNYEEVREELRTSTIEGKGLHDFKVLIEHVRDGLLGNAYVKLLYAAESLESARNNPAYSNLITHLMNTAQKVYDLNKRIDSISVSRLVTIELTRIIRELEDISNSINGIINRINNIAGTSLFYKYNLSNAVGNLKNALNSINDARNNLLSSLGVATMINDKLSRQNVNEVLVDAITSLVLGNRLPNPAVLESITGFILISSGASLKGNNAKLSFKSRNSSRDDVLKALPFKYYE